MELASAMTDLARRTAAAEIHRRIPALSAEEARHVMLRETLGAELHGAAFPTWSARLSAFELHSPIAFDVREVLDRAAEEAEEALSPKR